MIRQHHLIAGGVVLPVLFACWLVAGRIGERLRLRRAVEVAAERSATIPRSGPDPLLTAAEAGHSGEEPVTPDGTEVLAEILRGLPADAKAALSSQRYGSLHPRMRHVLNAVMALKPSQLAAVAELPENAPVFLRRASANPDDFGGAVAAILREFAMQALKSIDPERALDIMARTDLADPLLGERGVEELQSSINSCLETWASSDPAAAVRWARENAHSLPDGPAHVAAALGVMARDDQAGAWEEMRAAGVDPGMALPRFAKALRSREDMDFCMERLGGYAGALAAEAPPDWVKDCGAPPGASLRTCVCVDFSRRLASSAGWEEARAFLGKWAVDPESRSASATAVVTEMITGDASASENGTAADWLVASLPETRRPAEVTALVQEWAERDFAAPADWLRSQPPSAWRDAGLAALCGKLAPFDPAAAAEWAGQIGDSALRKQALAGLSPTE